MLNHPYHQIYIRTLLPSSFNRSIPKSRNLSSIINFNTLRNCSIYKFCQQKIHHFCGKIKTFIFFICPQHINDLPQRYIFKLSKSIHSLYHSLSRDYRYFLVHTKWQSSVYSRITKNISVFFYMHLYFYDTYLWKNST